MRFAFKTGERLRVASYFQRQEFQRDEAVKACVLSLVDHAHAPSAEFLYDAIVGDGLANERAGIRY